MKQKRNRIAKLYPPGTTCLIDDCETRPQSQGYCPKHYQRLRRYGDVNFVHRHVYKAKDICGVTDRDGKCEKQMQARQMCQMHYRRWTLYKDPTITKRNPQPKYPRRYKFIVKHGHPNANKWGDIMEHRFVMSEFLGRALLPNENVHHINGDKLDNRLENLELWSHSQPRGQRIPDKVNYALEILSLYAPEKLRNTND